MALWLIFDSNKQIHFTCIVHQTIHKQIHFTCIVHELEEKLNTDLSNIYQWLVANKLTLNVSKTEFIYLALPTRAGSPQQHMPITVGPFCLTHPVNFPCGRKPEYPEETHDLRQSVDFYSFHMRTWFESH